MGALTHPNPLLTGEGRRTRSVRGERLAALAVLVLFGCGRTDPVRSAPPPPTPDPIVDAGLPDAGPPDAGPPEISDAGLCPQSSDAGFVTGTSPLGPLDDGILWVGTEAPTTHSCPHVTVHASKYPPGSKNVPVLSIDFSTYGTPVMLPQDLPGLGTLSDGTTMLQFPAVGHFTRADGLTVGHSVPNDQWRTIVVFEAHDAGFDFYGVADTLECPGSTWECL